MKKILFIALIAITVIGGAGLTSCNIVALECVELQGLTASLKKANSQGVEAVINWFYSANPNKMATEIVKCAGDATDIKDPRMIIILEANETVAESNRMLLQYVF